MMTPQLTEQYGHVERVSVVRAIFNPWVCARTGARLKPKAETAAPPATVLLMKVLRSMPLELLGRQASSLGGEMLLWDGGKIMPHACACQGLILARRLK